jgi:hypothetical protein
MWCSVRRRGVAHLYAVFALLGSLGLTAAVGSLRLADAVGAYVDRTLADEDAYYLRVSNIFRAEMSLNFSHSEIDATYSFRLMPDQVSDTVAAFHTGDLRYTYAAPRFVFALTNSLGIGEQTFNGSTRQGALSAVAPPQAPGMPAPATPLLAASGTLDSSLLPRARTLPAVAERAIATMTYRLERRVSLAMYAGYLIYGGLGSEAQQLLALQQTADGNVTVSYGVNARLVLLSSLVAAHGWNTLEDRYSLFTLSETCQLAWTRATSLDVGVGVSTREVEGPAQPATLATTPVAAVGVTHELRGRDVSGVLRASVTYTPLVDVVSGRIQNRLVATGTASVVKGDLRAGVSVNASQSVPTDVPDAATTLSANSFVGLQLTSWLGATMGGQVTRQLFASSDSATLMRLPSGTAWGVYCGLYGVSPAWRF